MKQILRACCRALLCCGLTAAAQPALPPPRVMDLAETLRVAGASNVELALARERLNEARALQAGTLWQWAPSISPGVGYRAHQDRIQNVEGRMLEVERDSVQLGPTFLAQLEAGEAFYRGQAAKAVTEAGRAEVEMRRQEAVAAAAVAFFDLARAQAVVGVAEESVRLMEEYAAQLERAVGAGLAFKGDALRVRVQADRNRGALIQARNRRRVSAARLAQVLHMDPAVELRAPETELAPLTLTPAEASVESLVNLARARRPDVVRQSALQRAAQKNRDAAKVAPWIPTVGAQVFVGGLAGGNDTSRSGLGASEDYQVTLGWRIGSGGLFDRTRVRAAEARLKAADLERVKLEDELAVQVVEAHTQALSAREQLGLSRRMLAAAGEAFQLSAGRREFGVGVVLETLTAEQEFTKAKGEVIEAVAEWNRAQYALLRATGQLTGRSD